MKDLKITDVRVLSGDSGFLLDDGKTSILLDSGFGFTGEQLADNIQTALKDRSLSYIFLTHSHYDHVLGSANVLRRFPQAKVVAGAYTKSIFDRPTAKTLMRKLDSQHAATCGAADYEDLTALLRVDIPVNDGDVLHCGGMTFSVVALPGHTKCSVGFYLAKEKLLLSPETLGSYFGGGSFLPAYLVGFEMTLESFRKARKLDIGHFLLPHYGLISGQEAQSYLEKARRAAVSAADRICSILKNGGTEEEALAQYRAAVYTENVRPAYPINAFNLNTSIMIRLLKKELLQKPV